MVEYAIVHNSPRRCAVDRYTRFFNIREVAKKTQMNDALAGALTTLRTGNSLRRVKGATLGDATGRRRVEKNPRQGAVYLLCEHRANI